MNNQTMQVQVASRVAGGDTAAKTRESYELALKEQDTRIAKLEGEIAETIEALRPRLANCVSRTTSSALSSS